MLLNRLGIVSAGQLQDAENDLVEFRLAQMRESPSLISRTYDFSHLRAIHRQLFHDVYEWAGEIRTVGLARDGGDSFMTPLDVARPLAHVATRVEELNLLRDVADSDLPGVLADIYDFVNFAHPFREGNGRAQREFFTQLLAESDRGLDWSSIGMSALHRACHVARNDLDLGPLTEMFGAVMTEVPLYPRSA